MFTHLKSFIHRDYKACTNYCKKWITPPDYPRIRKHRPHRFQRVKLPQDSKNIRKHQPHAQRLGKIRQIPKWPVTVHGALLDVRLPWILKFACRHHSNRAISSIGDMGFASNVMAALKMNCFLGIVARDFNRISYRVAFKNGVLDLSTLALVSPMAENFTTKFIDFDYHKKVTLEDIPNFEKFFNHMFHDGIEQVKQAVWTGGIYSLTGF